MAGFYGATAEAVRQPRASRMMGMGLLALGAVVASVVVVLTAGSQSAVELAAAPQMQMIAVPAQAGQQQLMYMMPAQPGQVPGQMIAVQPGQSLAAQPVQPSSLPVAVARPMPQPAAARVPAKKAAPVHHPARRAAVHHLQKQPYPAETEAQAAANAKVWARKEYLATYNAAMNAENAAELQERKNRAARAQHFKQRAQMFDALKKKADRKEGYVKLEREMGMIMDGVDGLHYRGYKH